MTPKLPVISGKQLIQVLERCGYTVSRQKGSHVRLHHSDPQRTAVTVPLHDEIAFGTLQRILRDAKITREQLISLL
jgi:predicted RNA binding protein YcfA (HicA-like mRNA interferase family)